MKKLRQELSMSTYQVDKTRSCPLGTDLFAQPGILNVIVKGNERYNDSYCSSDHDIKTFNQFFPLMIFRRINFQVIDIL